MSNDLATAENNVAPEQCSPEVIVEAENLTRHFDVSAPWLNRVIERKEKSYVKAVDGISFQINAGETFSLVGESGCGKSTVGNVVVGLYAPTKGAIRFKGVELGGQKDRRRNIALQSQMQMIFQDPYASLNPRWRVAKIVAEPILAHGKGLGDKTMSDRVAELLLQVGLAPEDGEKFPHEFSGGQRQRISIARALAGEPEFIVCDEPTSALDVSVQAQILNLMKDLQRKLGLTYLFISHDMAVVHHISTIVGVMYLGRLVEWNRTQDLFNDPKHPYTKMLLSAIPDLTMTGKARTPVAGEVPSPINPPSGCTFHPRCPLADKRCSTERPLARQVGGAQVACHAVEEDRT